MWKQEEPSQKIYFFFFHKISDSDGTLNHLSYYEAAILFLDTNSHFNETHTTTIEITDFYFIFHIFTALRRRGSNNYIPALLA